MKQLFQKFKGYAITGLVCLMVGFILAWSIKPKTKTEFLAGEIKTVMMDTCLESKLLCTLTTKDSLAIYRYIREGLKSKSEKVVAQIDEVREPTEEQKQKPLMERKYTKILNNGVVTVWDTLTVLGTIENWDRAYKINEVVEVQEKVTTTTAVIEAGKDDSNTETTKYLPIETTPKKMTYLGIGGLVTKNPKQYDFSAGLSLSHGKTSVSLFKDIKTDFKSLEGYSIGINRQLIRLSAK